MGKPIKYYPLNSNFMLIAIVGLLITMIFFDKFGLTWGFTLGLVFVIMFLSSMITMTRAPPVEEHMAALAHHKKKKKKK